MNDCVFCWLANNINWDAFFIFLFGFFVGGSVVFGIGLAESLAYIIAETRPFRAKYYIEKKEIDEKE